MTLPTTPPTEAANLLKKLREAYSSEDMTQHLRFLIYGTSGSGKTYSLRTARYPLLIDSFDPGGSTALSDLVANGNALVVSEYERENARKPTAFKAWDDNFDKLEKAGVFNSVGTYVLDSATTWATAALNYVMFKAGRAGMTPQQNDWYPQMTLLELGIKRILSLPCDVVFLCHDDIMQDEITKRIFRMPLFTGKLRKRIPLLFSEIYYADVKTTAKGHEYTWRIEKDLMCEARSRLHGIPSNLSVEEIVPQDFGALMKRFHIPYENKPAFE